MTDTPSPALSEDSTPRQSLDAIAASFAKHDPEGINQGAEIRTLLEQARESPDANSIHRFLVSAFKSQDLLTARRAGGALVNLRNAVGHQRWGFLPTMARLLARLAAPPCDQTLATSPHAIGQMVVDGDMLWIADHLLYETAVFLDMSPAFRSWHMRNDPVVSDIGATQGFGPLQSRWFEYVSGDRHPPKWLISPRWCVAVPAHGIHRSRLTRLGEDAGQVLWDAVQDMTCRYGAPLIREEPKPVWPSIIVDRQAILAEQAGFVMRMGSREFLHPDAQADGRPLTIEDLPVFLAKFAPGRSPTAAMREFLRLVVWDDMRRSGATQEPDPAVSGFLRFSWVSSNGMSKPPIACTAWQGPDQTMVIDSATLTQSINARLLTPGWMMSVENLSRIPWPINALIRCGFISAMRHEWCACLHPSSAAAQAARAAAIDSFETPPKHVDVQADVDNVSSAQLCWAWSALGATTPQGFIPVKETSIAAIGRRPCSFEAGAAV